MNFEITSENKDEFLVIGPGRVLRSILGINYTSSSDQDIQNVPFKIVENRYKLSENHKIELVPLIKGFAVEKFYITDFRMMLNSGYFSIFKKVDMK